MENDRPLLVSCHAGTVVPHPTTIIGLGSMTLSRGVPCAALATLPKPPGDPNGGYVVEEDSDEYGAMSSDEELDDPVSSHQ